MSLPVEEQPLAVSVKEAARRIGVSPLTITRLIDDKRLKASRIVGRAGARGRVVIHVASLVNLLDATKVQS